VSPWPGGANPRPGLALGEEVAYVSDPPTGDVVEVDLEGLRITRRISVGGAPTSLTMLPAPEGQVHGGMNTAGKNVSEAVF
ncbi:MAG: hypothetical protein RML85_02425, partial [Acidobacteriota bacterium]|nr:hypothetical protein [Acidobacteriota bacterium]